MAENKAFKKVAARLSGIKEKKAAEIQECRDQIEAYKKQKAEAEKFAAQDDSLDAYMQSKTIADDSERKIKFLYERIGMLKDNSAVSADEYKEIRDAVLAEQKTIENKLIPQTESKIADLIGSFEKVLEEIIAGDQLLDDLDAIAKKERIYNNSTLSGDLGWYCGLVRLISARMDNHTKSK